MREIVSPLDGIRSPFGSRRFAFSPLSLFASGEEGAWYEPSTTTAFRSTTDLTPCDYGQSAGFLLDLSKGAGYSGGSFTGLGSELVTNGTFDTDLTGWTAIRFNGSIYAEDATVASVVSSQAVVAAASGKTAPYIETSFPTVVGTTYFVSVGLISSNTTTEIIAASASGVNQSSRASDSIARSGNISSVGTKTLVFTATTTTSYLRLQLATGNTTDTATWDNISVRELPGNHATQSSEPARPILARVPETGRRNLLERTEEFDNAYWSLSRSTITVDATTNPFGTTTASAFEQDANTISGLLTLTAGVSWAATQTFSIYAKANTKNFLMIETAIGVRTWFDLSSGSVGTSSASHTANVIPLEDDWYRLSVSSAFGTRLNIYLADTDNSTTVVGSGGIYIWGAQLEEGSSATDYQRVSSEYDITEAGVTSLEYLAFDGSDDELDVTKFSVGPASSVFLGLEPASEITAATTYQNILRARTGESPTNGAIIGFGSFTGNATNETFTWLTLNGTGNIHSRSNISAAPHVFTLNYTGTQNGETMRFDGADEVFYRGLNPFNASRYPSDYGSISSGGNLNGKLFSLIVRGAASTTQEISDTETYLAAKSGVTIP